MAVTDYSEHHHGDLDVEVRVQHEDHTCTGFIAARRNGPPGSVEPGAVAASKSCAAASPPREPGFRSRGFEVRQSAPTTGCAWRSTTQGAGLASLRHIVTLAPDIIKINRALVADLNSDRARRALVMAVVMYALEMGTTVVGEGVETTEGLEVLKTLGVDAVQGYLLGRPTTDHETWFTWVAHPQEPGKTGDHSRVRLSSDSGQATPLRLI